MCGETRIPRDMCAGNTLPGETYITVTPALVLAAQPDRFFSDQRLWRALSYGTPFHMISVIIDSKYTEISTSVYVIPSYLISFVMS